MLLECSRGLNSINDVGGKLISAKHVRRASASIAELIDLLYLPPTADFPSFPSCAFGAQTCPLPVTRPPWCGARGQDTSGGLWPKASRPPCPDDLMPRRGFSREDPGPRRRRCAAGRGQGPARGRKEGSCAEDVLYSNTGGQWKKVGEKEVIRPPHTHTHVLNQCRSDSPFSLNFTPLRDVVTRQYAGVRRVTLCATDTFVYRYTRQCCGCFLSLRWSKCDPKRNGSGLIAFTYRLVQPHKPAAVL